MNDPVIRECPFCGGDDCRIKQYFAYTDNPFFCVSCHGVGCHAEGPAADTVDEAISLWNKAFRSSDSLCKDAMIEWLAQAAANAGWCGCRISAGDMVEKARQAVRDLYNKEKQKESKDA